MVRRLRALVIPEKERERLCLKETDTQQPAPSASSLNGFLQEILGIRRVSQVPLPFQAGLAKCGIKTQVSWCENSG